jgi:ketose-bisphosphate aldolase
MALEKMSTILEEVDAKRTAVLAFGCHNYESIAWVVGTGEELKIPVIVMLYPGTMKYISAEVFASITKALAKKVKIAVGLHLDHCDSFDTIMGVIKAGFTSVMIDGSKLKYEENIRVTCEVVKVAHALGVDVEAELGKVGIAANKSDFEDIHMYTTAEQAADFAYKTKVDALAIAIGSAHGYYVETPKLDMNRLMEINKVIDTPLVLHGGTGIPDDQLKQSFRLGINKLNIATEFVDLFYSTTMNFQQIKNRKNNIFDLYDYQKKVIVNYLRTKFALTIQDTNTSKISK